MPGMIVLIVLRVAIDVIVVKKIDNEKTTRRLLMYLYSMLTNNQVTGDLVSLCIGGMGLVSLTKLCTVVRGDGCLKVGVRVFIRQLLSSVSGVSHY